VRTGSSLKAFWGKSVRFGQWPGSIRTAAGISGQPVLQALCRIGFAVRAAVWTFLQILRNTFRRRVFKNGGFVSSAKQTFCPRRAVVLPALRWVAGNKRGATGWPQLAL